MSVPSVLRSRSVSAVLLFAAIAVALLAVPAVARAQGPYPPTGPSSAPAASSPAAGSTAQQPASRTTNTESGGTAGTGFQTLTATGIAVALLGGGAALLVAGRRRRRTG
jgi:hypothetical protein